jgi:enterochelin esterase-like enzyme
MTIQRALLLIAINIVFATTLYAGEIARDSLRSDVLGHEIPFTIYLPDNYQSTIDNLPVVYLLHGANQNEYSWIENGGVKETLDGLISRDRLRPTIVVMPTVGPDSWWVDGNAEKAETALIKELFPYIEKKYKAISDRKGRAIAGISMGGYGALNLSLRFPTQFCAAGIISPAIYDPLPPETSSARKSPQFFTHNVFNPESWMALNYPANLQGYTQSNVRVPVWIVSGGNDHFGIALIAAQLHSRIMKIQPEQVEFRVIEGGHDWMTFRDALPDTLQYINKFCMNGR